MANNIYTNIPALTIEMASNLFTCAIDAELPALDAELHAGATLDSSIGRMTCTGAAHAGGVASVNASLPAMEIVEIRAGLALVAKLPRLTMTGSAYQPRTGTINAAIRALKMIAGTGNSEVVCSINARIRRPVGTLTGTVQGLGDIETELPRLTVAIVGLNGNLGNISARLPALRMIATTATVKQYDNEIDGEIPALYMDGTIAGSCDFQLKHTRGAVR